MGVLDLTPLPEMRNLQQAEVGLVWVKGVTAASISILGMKGWQGMAILLVEE